VSGMPPAQPPLHLGHLWPELGATTSRQRNRLDTTGSKFGPSAANALRRSGRNRDAVALEKATALTSGAPAPPSKRLPGGVIAGPSDPMAGLFVGERARKQPRSGVGGGKPTDSARVYGRRPIEIHQLK